MTSALWYYVSDSDGWRLIIASPVVRERGPEEAYKTVQRVLADLPSSGIRLPDVWVIKETEPLITLIKSAVSTAASDISNIRFTRNSVNGVYIEDAHIYRST